MKNKKLNLINELLWEFDCSRSSIDDLNQLKEQVAMIRNNFPKEYVFYKVLDFIEIEINFTIESLIANSERSEL